MDSDLRIRKSPKVSVSQEIPRNPKKLLSTHHGFLGLRGPRRVPIGRPFSKARARPMAACQRFLQGDSAKGGWFWGDLFNGHFRNPNWRYLPYIRPILQAYVREYTHKIWTMVQYLHFRILKWPLIYLSIYLYVGMWVCGYVGM